MDGDKLECFDMPGRRKVKWISLFYIQRLEMLLFCILRWLFNHAVDKIFPPFLDCSGSVSRHNGKCTLLLL